MQIPGVDPSQTMSVGAFWGFIVSTILGLSALAAAIRGWWLFSMQKSAHEMQMKKLREERIERQEKDQEDLIKRVCKEFTSDKQYLYERDQNVIALGRALIEEEFAFRAKSFVDTGEDRVRWEENDKRIARLESIVVTLRADIGADFRATAEDIVRRVTE